jgi:hypothetical protein
VKGRLLARSVETKVLDMILFFFLANVTENLWQNLPYKRRMQFLTEERQ